MSRRQPQEGLLQLLELLEGGHRRAGRGLAVPAEVLGHHLVERVPVGGVDDVGELPD
jgi:hypothetical protein